MSVLSYPEKCPLCGGRIKHLHHGSGAETMLCREPECSWQRDYEPWGGVDIPDGLKNKTKELE